MAWLADSNGEAVHIPDDVHDAYVSLIEEALDAQDSAARARQNALDWTLATEENEKDAARLLEQAAALIAPDVVVQVGEFNTRRVPGKQGRREVNREGIEEHSERLPARLRPREATVTKWPTVADIDKAADALDPDVLADLVLHPNPVPDTIKITRREAR